MSSAHVFISYSRRDYHFAESLALHLLKHGVPAWLDVKDLVPGVEWERDLMRAIDEAGAVVLVASPQALRSPNVRDEWQRALSQRKRIVVLRWFRRARLPPELLACEQVDFRGSFGPALARLLAVLGAPAGAGVAPATARLSRLPRLPPGVAAVALALAMPIIGYALTVGPHTTLDDAAEPSTGLGPAGQAIAMALFAAGLIWILCVSWLQRRMGLTRLLLCLGFVATPFVLAIGTLHWSGPSGLGDMPAGVAQTVVTHWPIGIAFAVFPLVAIVALLAWRPADVLRWLPTGKAWTAYRTRQGGLSGANVVDAREAFARIGAYRLRHDAADAPAAERLRDALRRAGAIEAPSDDSGATVVLLLTNRTPIDWVHAQSAALAGTPLLSVVGTAIGLPESLGWLWKRQWVDFRRWMLDRPAGERGLPGVPEAVGTVRTPPGVTRLHRLQCAFGTLLCCLGGILQPPESTPADDVSAAEMIGLFAVVAGALVMLNARRFLRRSVTFASFMRWTLAGIAAGIVAGALALDLLAQMLGPSPRWWIAATALVVLPAAGWHVRHEARWWLPQLDGTPKSVPARLAPAGDWRTLGNFLLFLFVWLLIVDPSITE